MVVFDGLGRERFAYEVDHGTRLERNYAVMNRHDRRKLQKLLRTGKEHREFLL